MSETSPPHSSPAPHPGQAGVSARPDPRHRSLVRAMLAQFLAFWIALVVVMISLGSDDSQRVLGLGVIVGWVALGTAVTLYLRAQHGAAPDGPSER